MPEYKLRVGFQGYADKDKTYVTFNLGTLADEAAALAAQTAIATPLALLTQADLYQELKTVVEDFDANPAFGVDTHDEAVIITHLNATGTKLHPSVRIPAPVAGVIMPDGMAVNTTNTDLIAFIQALSTYVKLSDGESIDTTTANGIKEGHIRSRAKSFDK